MSVCGHANVAWTLKEVLLADPLPNYNKVSYSQLAGADKELWSMIATRCRAGTKRPAPNLPTAFETALAELTGDIRIRLLLAPLPRSSGSQASSSNSAPAAPQHRPSKIENQLLSSLKQLGDQVSSLKRKQDHAFPPPPPHAETRDRKGGGKGKKGKGGGGKANRGGVRLPPGLEGMQTRTEKGENLCFSFNLPGGCSDCQPGQACSKGKHLCMFPGCQKAHSLQQHGR